MQLLLAALAKGAAVSQDGNLTIFEIFDTIRPSSLPAVQPGGAFVFRFLLEEGESRPFWNIEIALFAPDATVGFRAIGEVRPKPGIKLPAVSRPVMQGILELPILRFEAAGEYHFRLSLAGTDQAWIVPFSVSPVIDESDKAR